MAGAVTVATTGTVNRGDYLETSTVAGKAQSAGTAPTGKTFARALTAASGGSCTALLLPAAAETVGVAAATQAEQETGTATNVYTSPGKQQYHVSAAKAWINFNGTGTVAINASYNISSITDNGTGRYTINFTVAFSSIYYSAVVNASPSYGLRNSYGIGLFADDITEVAPTAGATRVSINGTDGVGYDPKYVTASFSGDQ